MTRFLPLPFLANLHLAALSLAYTGLLSGCVAQASEHRYVMLDDDLLKQASLDELGSWQSAPWTRAPWIPYPGRSIVTVFHSLGRQPTDVTVYISGEPDDSDKSNTRHAYAGAGNIATIIDVTEESVSLKNNTAGAFYIRLVLR